MKRTTLIAAGLASLACAAPAVARAQTETITTVTPFPTFPASAPYKQTYTAQFTASGTFADSGTETVAATFGAVPSPAAAELQTVRTLTGSRGTLVLRCNQHATDLSNPAALPDVGTCTVLEATGAYVGLKGSGPLAGTFYTGPSVVVDTVQLGG